MNAHYITGKNIDLTKNHMDAVPPDDDTIYTLLGLLLMEEYGMDFTHEDIGTNLAEVPSNKKERMELGELVVNGGLLYD